MGLLYAVPFGSWKMVPFGGHNGLRRVVLKLYRGPVQHGVTKLLATACKPVGVHGDGGGGDGGSGVGGAGGGGGGGDGGDGDGGGDGGGGEGIETLTPRPPGGCGGGVGDGGGE